MLVDEARKKDLKVGLSSSHFALNREFYPKWDKTFDTNDPEFYDLYWKPVKKEDPPTKKFPDHWWDRTTDIDEQYQPDILWCDFGLDKPGFEPVSQKDHGVLSRQRVGMEQSGRISGKEHEERIVSCGSDGP